MRAVGIQVRGAIEETERYHPLDPAADLLPDFGAHGVFGRLSGFDGAARNLEQPAAHRVPEVAREDDAPGEHRQRRRPMPEPVDHARMGTARAVGKLDRVAQHLEPRITEHDADLGAVRRQLFPFQVVGYRVFSRRNVDRVEQDSNAAGRSIEKFRLGRSQLLVCAQARAAIRI